MNIARFVSVVAMAALLCVGCDTTHSPFLEQHGSEGWHVSLGYQHFGENHLPPGIMADYKNYLASLTREERISAYENNTRILEGGTGKQAIEISIPLPGLFASVWWEHILIYNTNNVRIQTLKSKAGHSIR